METAEMTNAEKIVENATITAISRLAMLVLPFLVSALAIVFWNRIDGIDQTATTALNGVGALQTRMSVQETTVSAGDANGRHFQDQVLASLNSISATQVEQGKQIATIMATIAIEKDQKPGR